MGSLERDLVKGDHEGPGQPQRPGRRLLVLDRDAMRRGDTPSVEAQPASEWLLSAP
jgi:hypothetical protein